MTARTTVLLIAMGLGAANGCCNSKPPSQSDMRSTAKLCIEMCPGDPSGSEFDKAMNKGCREGCIEDCEAKYPGTCKGLLK